MERFLEAAGNGRVLVGREYFRLADIGKDHVRGSPQWATGDRVAVTGMRGSSLLAVIFAIWRMGGVPVIGANEFELAGWPGDHSLWKWPDLLVRPALADFAPDEIGFVHRTSGSTGKPKYAMRSIESLVWEAVGYRDCYAIPAGAKAYLAAPIEHSFAFGAMFGFLLAGADVELEPVFNPRRLVDRLAEGTTDFCLLTPTMARLAIIAAQSKCVRSSVRCAIVGAGSVPEALNSEFEETFGLVLGRNYGSSETGATFGMPTYAGEAIVGRPFAGIKVVTPAASGSAEAGDEEELILDLPEPVFGCEGGRRLETEKKVRRWQTGDRARFDDEGRLVLAGRMDDLVKINGHVVDLARVVAITRAVDGVIDAVAFKMSRPGREENADVIVTCEMGFAPSDRLEREVIGAIAAALGPVPVVVRSLNHLPRTSAGKPDIVRLRSTFSQTELQKKAQS